MHLYLENRRFSSIRQGCNCTPSSHFTPSFDLFPRHPLAQMVLIFVNMSDQYE